MSRSLFQTIGGLGLMSLLLAILTVLVVVPFGMLIYASFLTAVPFSGERDLAFTLANYADLWSADLGRACVNTLIVSLGGSAMAMALG